MSQLTIIIERVTSNAQTVWGKLIKQKVDEIISLPADLEVWRTCDMKRQDLPAPLNFFVALIERTIIMAISSLAIVGLALAMSWLYRQLAGSGNNLLPTLIQLLAMLFTCYLTVKNVAKDHGEDSQGWKQGMVFGDVIGLGCGLAILPVASDVSMALVTTMLGLNLFIYIMAPGLRQELKNKTQSPA
jgi:hypothetical protein